MYNSLEYGGAERSLRHMTLCRVLDLKFSCHNCTVHRSWLKGYIQDVKKACNMPEFVTVHQSLVSAA
jgi:hypothetical protein